MYLAMHVCGGQPQQCVRLSSMDRFSTPPPQLITGSLFRVSPTPIPVSSAGDLIAVGMQETLRFRILNLNPQVSSGFIVYATLGHLQPLIALGHKTYLTPQDFNSLAANFSLPLCAVLNQPPYDAHEGVVCLTPGPNPLTGQRLHFLALFAGELALSEDTYSYPIRPTVYAVTSTGCRNSGNSTVDCPTAGNVQITVRGSGFSPSDISISVAGLACVNISLFSGEAASCNLPAGTGNQVSVVVSSFALLSESAALLSYASPTILNVTCGACTGRSDNPADGSIQLSHCERKSSSAATRLLHLTGRNFGPPGSTVFIGSTKCKQDGFAIGDGPSDSRVSCQLPSGKSIGQPIILIQNNGKISESKLSISYSPCPAGTYDAQSQQPDELQCTRCPLGRFSTEGSVACLPCPSGLYLSSTQMTASSADCAACPSGASCTGDGITSAAGFYLEQSTDGRIIAYQCPGGYCTTCDDERATSTSAEQATVPMRTCCSANRDPTSALCGQCMPGFEDWGGQCKQCTSNNGGLVFVFLLLSGIVVVSLAHSASSPLD